MSRKIIKATDSIGKLTGCHIFSPDFVFFHPAFIVMMIDLVTYLSVSFDNIYEFRKDFERQIFCVVTLGMGFQAIMKIYTFVVRREDVLKLLKLAEDFHESSNDPKVAKIFEKWMMVMAHIGGFLALLYSAVALLIFIYPAIFYLIVGTKILHFGFILPGIDWTTPTGYIINFIFQTYQIYGVVSSFFATCIYMIFFIINVFGQFELIEVEVEKLGELAVRNKKNVNDEKIKNSMKQITNEHVKLVE
jgi:hypothetical protein